MLIGAIAITCWPALLLLPLPSGAPCRHHPEPSTLYRARGLASSVVGSCHCNGVFLALVKSPLSSAQCTALCGRTGFQSRILQCAWSGSSRPAGNACRDQQRPSVMRPCRGQPCQSNGKNCTDRSSFCSLAKSLHLCRLSRYQNQCCESCRKRGHRGPTGVLPENSAREDSISE